MPTYLYCLLADILQAMRKQKAIDGGGRPVFGQCHGNTLSEEMLVVGVDRIHLPHMLNLGHNVLLSMPKAEHVRSTVSTGQVAIEFIMAAEVADVHNKLTSNQIHSLTVLLSSFWL